jgi:hypothetical protein
MPKIDRATTVIPGDGQSIAVSHLSNGETFIVCRYDDDSNEQIIVVTEDEKRQLIEALM